MTTLSYLSRPWQSAGKWACVGLVVFGLGCSKTSKEKQKEVEQVAQKGAEQTPKPEPAPGTEPFVMKGEVLPTGPRMIIDPGQGISAMRFGATFETLERHMGAPCDIKTEDKCIFVDQAVEFTMKDGVVVGMKAHRRDRQIAGASGKYYGTFFGIMFPKIVLGLHKHVVIEEFGEPQKIAPLRGPDGQLEAHTYDGVILEYDKLKNGNVVLSAFEVVPSKTAQRGPQKAATEGAKTGADSKKTGADSKKTGAE
jgi:hypothetical protein